MLREADRAQLTDAVKAAVDAASWYTPAPKPDYSDTDLSIACSKAKADVAQEVVDAVLTALTATPGSADPNAPSEPGHSAETPWPEPQPARPEAPEGAPLTASWRAIPMPPRVARMPRNSAGRPVPGNTPWYETADKDGPMAVRRSADLGVHVACLCEPGRGIPAFGDQCPYRQRQFMAQRRCAICTTSIKPTSRLLFIGGPGASFYIEPPVHARCAAYALQVCPVLSAAGDEVELAIARTYQLRERRSTGLGPDLKPTYDVFPYRDPAARLLGVLDFYLAYPEDAEHLAGADWLAHRAPPL
ncbi:MAG: hypothetical protein JO362_12075 [Streptomycetaceae bacterium]|nr:hypothetical protein [Streptomycetaceae bacterium]